MPLYNPVLWRRRLQRDRQVIASTRLHTLEASEMKRQPLDRRYLTRVIAQKDAHAIEMLHDGFLVEMPSHDSGVSMLSSSVRHAPTSLLRLVIRPKSHATRSRRFCTSSTPTDDTTKCRHHYHSHPCPACTAGLILATTPPHQWA